MKESIEIRADDIMIPFGTGIELFQGEESLLRVCIEKAKKDRGEVGTGNYSVSLACLC